MSDEITLWKSVSPKYLFEALIEVGLIAIIPLVASTIPLWVEGTSLGPLSVLPLVVVVIVVGMAVAFVPRRVRALGYALRSDDVVFKRGVFFQRQVAVPYGRLQLVDVTRGPLSRVLGLAELRLVTAAATTGVVIPGLPFAVAQQLRDDLIAVAETRRAGL